MALTDDPKDPRLKRGSNLDPHGQEEAYLVLSDEERAKGFIRPVRDSYVHDLCGTVTTMARALAETYARDPKFYGATYCSRCRNHPPVAEFRWINGDGSISDERVGS